jgi:glutathione synthase/RimK-type ligase-like ATP-grasp enzyme
MLRSNLSEMECKENMHTNSLNRSFSVLIPDGESGFALFAAHCLSYFSNVKIYVLSKERWSSIRFSRYCHSYTFEPVTDDATHLEGISKLVSKNKIDVLLPTDTKELYFALANKEVLASMAALAPLPDPKAFEIANNKWLLSQFLEENQIPGPPSILVNDNHEFAARLKDLEFPVLLKPMTSRDGKGIKQFDTPSDLMHFLDQQRPDTIRNRFIVQGFLSGSDVDLNFLSRDGEMLALTIQQAIIPNRRKYGAAGAIRFIQNEKFSAVARKLVAGLAWSGFANVDTICDDNNNLRIVDINARFWGSVRGSLAVGVSFPYLACLAALDIPFPMPNYEPIRYFHPQTALREEILGILGRSQERNITFRESGFKFFLTDPIGEIIRVYYQEFLGV